LGSQELLHTPNVPLAARVVCLRGFPSSIERRRLQQRKGRQKYLLNTACWLMQASVKSRRRYNRIADNVHVSFSDVFTAKQATQLARIPNYIPLTSALLYRLLIPSELAGSASTTVIQREGSHHEPREFTLHWVISPNGCFCVVHQELYSFSRFSRRQSYTVNLNNWSCHSHTISAQCLHPARQSHHVVPAAWCEAARFGASFNVM
jgi:hypothetical protein